MLFTWRQYDSHAILNFGAVGAVSRHFDHVKFLNQ